MKEWERTGVVGQIASQEDRIGACDSRG